MCSVFPSTQKPTSTKLHKCLGVPFCQGNKRAGERIRGSVTILVALSFSPYFLVFWIRNASQRSRRVHPSKNETQMALATSASPYFTENCSKDSNSMSLKSKNELIPLLFIVFFFLCQWLFAWSLQYLQRKRAWRCTNMSASASLFTTEEILCWNHHPFVRSTFFFLRHWAFQSTNKGSNVCCSRRRANCSEKRRVHCERLFHSARLQLNVQL